LAQDIPQKFELYLQPSSLSFYPSQINPLTQFGVFAPNPAVAQAVIQLVFDSGEIT